MKRLTVCVQQHIDAFLSCVFFPIIRFLVHRAPTAVTALLLQVRSVFDRVHKAHAARLAVDFEPSRVNGEVVVHAGCGGEGFPTIIARVSLARHSADVARFGAAR